MAINLFPVYRLMYPFRSRLQQRLRQQRLGKDFADFALSLGNGPRGTEIANALWDALREAAFIPDFRPDAYDDLEKVYAMGGEEVRDDLIEPIIETLRLTTVSSDLSNLDFSSVSTPKAAAELLATIARNGAGNSEDRIPN